MINPIINARLASYHPKRPKDEENALKEILKEIALFSLSTSDFFQLHYFRAAPHCEFYINYLVFQSILILFLKNQTSIFNGKNTLKK